MGETKLATGDSMKEMIDSYEDNINSLADIAVGTLYVQKEALGEPTFLRR